MTRDELLTMAREAGYGDDVLSYHENQRILERFHALAVAPYKDDAERYRWLRDAADRDDEGHCYIAQNDWIAEGEGDDAGDEGVVTHWLQNEEADEAIDRARSAK